MSDAPRRFPLDPYRPVRPAPAVSAARLAEDIAIAPWLIVVFRRDPDVRPGAQAAGGNRVVSRGRRVNEARVVVAR